MMKKMNKKSIMAIVFAAMFVFASVAGIFLPKQASAVGKRGNRLLPRIRQREMIHPVAITEVIILERMIMMVKMKHLHMKLH